MLSDEYENLLAFRTSLRQFLHWSHSQALAVGLTPAQHQLMVAVKGHPDGKGPAISDLAGYLLLRHHSAVELVGRAAAAGLVERYADTEDGRVTTYVLLILAELGVATSTLLPIAGYVGITCGVTAWYVAFAHVTNATFRRELIPTWPLS